jgi:hypothetical protein
MSLGHCRIHTHACQAVCSEAFDSLGEREVCSRQATNVLRTLVACRFEKHYMGLKNSVKRPLAPRHLLCRPGGSVLGRAEAHAGVLAGLRVYPPGSSYRRRRLASGQMQTEGTCPKGRTAPRMKARAKQRFDRERSARGGWPRPAADQARPPLRRQAQARHVRRMAAPQGRL